MKTKNKDNRSARHALATLAVLAVVSTAAVAGMLAYGKLHDLWVEQSVITDVNRQVQVRSGSSISTDTVREMFGLRNGTNLALTDFAAKREAALKKFPVIKSIGISRRLPDGVSISVVERDPLARIGVSGVRKESGRVCDDEGVVFTCRRGAEMLPLIREPEEPGTKPGEALKDRARSALTVLLVAREPQFADLNILEIDTAKPDFLEITLTNYSSIKFRWTGMDSFTPESDAALREQLTKVSQAIGNNLSGEVKVWNATVQGVVTSITNRPN